MISLRVNRDVHKYINRHYQIGQDAYKINENHNLIYLFMDVPLNTVSGRGDSFFIKVGRQKPLFYRSISLKTSAAISHILSISSFLIISGGEK